jgi:uncharacterized protein YcbX
VPTDPSGPIVTALRRYPVKAMGGESLLRATLDARGLTGDRWYAVVDGDGRFATAKDSRRFRRRDEVFAYAATTGADGTVEVSRGGRTWRVGDADLDAELSARFGDPVRVLPEQETPHYDAAAVSLVGTATLAWCARELGVDADPRRLRVNLLLETDEPFVEETWPGRTLDVGSVRLRVEERIERCRTIDLAQDGVATTERWLKALGGSRDLCVGIYARVDQPGDISVGDHVQAR